MVQANTLAQGGHWAEAATLWERVLGLEEDFPPALNHLGSYHSSRGNLALARNYLERAVTKAPTFAMAHANLSRIHEMQGDHESALAAINRAVVADPAAWAAHLEKARLLETLGREREAASAWGNALAYLPESSSQSPQLQALLQRGRQMVAENQAELRTFLQQRLDGLLTSSGRRELERFEHCLDILTGRREFVTARPLTVPFPRLPAIPIFHREDFDWVPEIESAYPDILRELESLLAEYTGFVPYVQTPAGTPTGQFDALDRNPDWSAYFLWKNGLRFDAQADRCPKTEAAVFRTPLNTVPNRAPVAFFSALQPGTHIPPHTGATNTRLTVHLPLIVPPDCALRVGGETHVWEPGKIVIFDDTILHEAWNFSDRLRVVLIFDVWHPMLTPLERELVAHTVEGIMAFYGESADLGEL